jgi:3-oxoacyl-[acyl-carrier protein] reductase
MGRNAVIVTGGGRGIGRAIAERLAAEGYDLALVDVNGDQLRATAAQLASSCRVESYECDVTEWDQVERVVTAAQGAFGALYGLVNNAGITADALIVRLSPQQWRRVLDVNLTGTFHFTKAVAPHMMRQRIGRIVNIASVIGLSGNAGQANYAASKAGVIALTKSAARELAGRAITVNAVAPGYIATDMTAGLSDEIKAEMLRRIPLKRFGEAPDIAGVVAFLMSPDAAYLTGQTLVCDGGMVL